MGRLNQTNSDGEMVSSTNVQLPCPVPADYYTDGRFVGKYVVIYKGIIYAMADTLDKIHEKAKKLDLDDVPVIDYIRPPGVYIY